MNARSLICFIAPATLLVANVASATLVVDVGDHNLFANTPDQSIDVLISSDPGDPLTSGINLNVEIGDGFGPNAEPVFDGLAGSQEGFDFDTGIYFGGSVGGSGPLAGFPSLLQANTAISSDAIPDGTLVTLIIDTTGFSTIGDTFAVRLVDHLTPLGDTEILGPVGAALPPIAGVVVNNGSITIVAIPEPGTIAWFGVLTAAGVVRWRPKR